jgi:hypothetical protein
MALWDGVPEALQQVHTRPLFVLRLKVRPIIDAGAVPAGARRIGVIFGGSFAGDRLSGEVLDGGSDWQTQRPDGALALDVRLVLRANDGALVTMTYQGLRHGPPEVIAAIGRGEETDPAAYYFRTTPRFETAAPHYDWLNRIVAIGAGHRAAAGVLYSVFEIL